MTVQVNDLIRRVITRRRVPPGQVTLYKVLYENPAGLSRAQLADTIRGSDEKSSGGVLLALAQRVNGTPGLDVIRPGLQFLIERDETREGVHYRLRQETRAVIDSLPKLLAEMGKPVSEIRQTVKDENSWLEL
jgi:hypothetical protein